MSKDIMADPVSFTMDLYKAVSAFMWALFDVKDPGYHIDDMRGVWWIQRYSSVAWWTEEPTGDDLDDPEYAERIYGTSFWSNETHSIAVLYGSRGGYAVLLDNSRCVGVGT